MDEKTSEAIAAFSNWMTTHNVTIQAEGLYQARPDGMGGLLCSFGYSDFTFIKHDDRGAAEFVKLSLNEPVLNDQDQDGWNAHDFLEFALQCALENGWDAFFSFGKHAVAGMKALHGEESVAA